MKLVLCGGIPGVGKTTLLSWLKRRFAGRIKFVDAGDLFRRYFYNEKVKTIKEIEELIVRKFARMPRGAVVVAHWHYAVRRPSGFIPQIRLSRLKRIAYSGRVEKVILLLVEAPIDVVRKRRRRDYRVKRRSFSSAVICEEVRADEKLLAEHHNIFSRVLGSAKAHIVRLTNTNLSAAKHRLSVLFTDLLG